MRFLISFVFLVGLCSYSYSYDSTSVNSIEGITSEMLSFISCEIGEEKDWDDFRNLFLPNAQFASLRLDREGREMVRARSLEEFVRIGKQSYPRNGFIEYPIGPLQIQEFSGIATAFQPFYCKNLSGTYEARGINSYHLVYKDNRWWITHSLFTNESEEYPLPNSMLFEEYHKD